MIYFLPNSLIIEQLMQFYAKFELLPLRSAELIPPNDTRYMLPLGKIQHNIAMMIEHPCNASTLYVRR